MGGSSSAESPTPLNPFDELPSEVISHISSFYFETPHDVFSLICVCRRAFDVLADVVHPFFSLPCKEIYFHPLRVPETPLPYVSYLSFRYSYPPNILPRQPAFEGEGQFPSGWAGWRDPSDPMIMVDDDEKKRIFTSLIQNLPSLTCFQLIDELGPMDEFHPDNRHSVHGYRKPSWGFSGWFDIFTRVFTPSLQILELSSLVYPPNSLCRLLGKGLSSLAGAGIVIRTLKLERLGVSTVEEEEEEGEGEFDDDDDGDDYSVGWRGLRKLCIDSSITGIELREILGNVSDGIVHLRLSRWIDSCDGLGLTFPSLTSFHVPLSSSDEVLSILASAPYLSSFKSPSTTDISLLDPSSSSSLLPTYRFLRKLQLKSSELVARSPYLEKLFLESCSPRILPIVLSSQTFLRVLRISFVKFEFGSVVEFFEGIVGRNPGLARLHLSRCTFSNEREIIPFVFTTVRQQMALRSLSFGGIYLSSWHFLSCVINLTPNVTSLRLYDCFLKAPPSDLTLLKSISFESLRFVSFDHNLIGLDAVAHIILSGRNLVELSVGRCGFGPVKLLRRLRGERKSFGRSGKCFFRKLSLRYPFEDVTSNDRVKTRTLLGFADWIGPSLERIELSYMSSNSVKRTLARKGVVLH